jgi:hypothetical protein
MNALIESIFTTHFVKLRLLVPNVPLLLPPKRMMQYDFASWTVHFVNICMKNQQMHQMFI